MKQGRFADSIKRISKLDRYIPPERIEGAIKLDSNENFALDAKFVKDIAQEAATQVDLREYPIDQLGQLYARLSKYVGIDEKCIAAGSGSDQVIELLLSSLGCKSATVFTPTFSYFVNRCELHGIRVEKVSLTKNFDLSTKAFVKSACKSDLAYICSPNNPTGNQFDRQTVLEVLDSLDDKLVLIDEAYVDFADYSLSGEATKRDNVIVLRTLSKAFGLAGARVGYMAANEKFTKIFRSTIQSPYPISVLSLAIASGVLARSEQVKKTISLVRKERERVFERLSRISKIRTFRSDANFVFIETGNNYALISKGLASAGIAVKLIGSVPGHKGCMRVTIGIPEVNDRFLQTVEEALL
ncbi:MAG TPA: histidinol-phosphate transaminase [Nitrososphaera sp.]|nr:histidinol-phosphate transaminase [Nitrososphaera sp.]